MLLFTRKTRQAWNALAKENDIIIKKNCADEIIGDYCKLTCDNCGDDSAAPSISVSAAPSISVTAPGCFDIEGERFDVNHSSGKHKGCIWLRNNLDEQAKLCVFSDAKLICKKTCDIGCELGVSLWRSAKFLVVVIQRVLKEYFFCDTFTCNVMLKWKRIQS